MPSVRARALLLCLAVSAVAVLPFHFLARRPAADPTLLAMPFTHDIAMHFDHMRAFSRGLAAGKLQPRWDDEANKGFGAPSPSYHPPGIYYVTSLVHAVAGDWGLTFLLTHLLVMLASALAVHRYARRHLEAGPSLVAMAAYVLFPYHLIDLYQRGAMAEWLTFVWMPLLLLAVEKLFEAESRRGRLMAAAGLALSYGGLVWSHLPTALQFGLALGVYAALLAWSRREAGTLGIAALAMVLGSGLAAAYLLPAVGEQDLVRPDLVQGKWPYHESYLFGPRPAEAPAEFWRALNVIGALGGAGVLAGAFLALRSPADGVAGALRGRVRAWTALGLVACFMMTGVSEPLGRLIPRLEMTAFPWRMLCIVTLAVSLLAGAMVQAGGARRLAAFAFLALCLGVSVVSVALPMAGSPEFHPRAARPTAENLWVVPRTADARSLPEGPRARLDRAGRVEVVRWDPETRVIAIDAAEASWLTLRTFDFPGWTARLDGRQVAIARGDHGEIVLALPAGAHEVRLAYGDTPLRRAGRWVTAVSAAIVLLLWLAATFAVRA